MENINASLIIWLDDVFSNIILEDKLLNDSSSENLRIKLLGAFVFSLPYESSMEEVLNSLSVSLDIEESALNDMMVATEACLLCAVSQACEKRSIFVQRMIKLDPAVQNDLMHAIKGNMQRYRERVDREYVIPKESLRSNEDVREATTCFRCSEKDKEIQYLNRQLSNNFKKEGEVENQLRNEIVEKVKKLADAELSLLDREDQLNQKDIEIERQAAKISELSQKLSLQATLSTQVAKLQDELDVLRPIAQRLTLPKHKCKTARATGRACGGQAAAESRVRCTLRDALTSARDAARGGEPTEVQEGGRRIPQSVRRGEYPSGGADSPSVAEGERDRSPVSANRVDERCA